MPNDEHRLPQTRVTRDDWVAAALTALKSAGSTGVKVAQLAEQLNIRRSSFYWYFADRAALEQVLLEIWEAHNVASIVDHAGRPAPSITAAVLHLFECWADPALFDHRLEFAVREWARRDDSVRERLERADARRIEAIADMHRRFGDDDTTAVVRARVQYHSQIGMYALGVDEPTDERLRLAPTYLAVFTGQQPTDVEIAKFTAWVREHT